MKTELLKVVIENTKFDAANITELISCLDESQHENALSILLGLQKPHVDPLENKTFPDTKYIKDVKVHHIKVNYLNDQIIIFYSFVRESALLSTIDSKKETKTRINRSAVIDIKDWNEHDIIEF